MITAVRVEAIGESPAELQAEIDAVLVHFCMAGYLEGVVPQRSEVADEVYPRRQGQTGWKSPEGREFWMQFEGRKVLRFEPNEGWDVQRPIEQIEYQVVDLGHEPVPDTTPSPRVTGDVSNLSGSVIEQLAEPILRDVTPEVIVLRRQLPMNWPYGVRPGYVELEPAHKPIDAGGLRLFSDFALRPEVEEAFFVPGEGGWTITALLSVKTGENMAMGWRAEHFGETLGEAATAASADVDARLREMGNVGGYTLKGNHLG